MTLRSNLIRLAHANPSLRKDLLPLLKSAGKGPNQKDIEYAIVAFDGLFHSAKIPGGLETRWLGNGKDVVNGGIFDLPVPRGFESLFKSISVEVRWVNPEYARVSWKYTHPNGGHNGSEIGEIGRDPKNGKWYWKNNAHGGQSYV